jgi:arylformamidase
MRIYDISLPLHPGLACWPGDAPYEWHWSWQKSAGASVNVGQVRTSVHAGTHTDAPYHFAQDGRTVEALDLGAYVGPARVVDVSGRPRIRVEDLPADLADAPRVLFRTGAWTDQGRFPESIPVMDPGVPAALGERGAVLVGVDVPSVDALDSKDLPNHHALGARGIAILESLHLAGVPEGVYELIALPLRLVGADGSPVRAILRVRDGNIRGGGEV